jgi:Spy/CpxP family protein refolding chaperone
VGAGDRHQTRKGCTVKTTRILLLSLLLATAASLTFAAELPPGKWWRRPELIQQLAITTDQQDKLEGIFRASADELIDLRADVEKRSLALRGELDQPQLNRENIRKLAGRVNEARNRLFERELMLLVDMRAVLTDSQWSRMRDMLEHMGPQNRQPGQGAGRFNRGNGNRK